MAMLYGKAKYGLFDIWWDHGCTYVWTPTSDHTQKVILMNSKLHEKPKLGSFENSILDPYDLSVGKDSQIRHSTSPGGKDHKFVAIKIQNFILEKILSTEWKRKSHRLEQKLYIRQTAK